MIPECIALILIRLLLLSFDLHYQRLENQEETATRLSNARRYIGNRRENADTPSRKEHRAKAGKANCRETETANPSCTRKKKQGRRT